MGFSVRMGRAQSVDGPDAKREAKFLKNLTDFRRQQHDLFLGGRFIQEIIPTGDNPTQEIPNYEITPVVLAAEWASVSGEHVYLIVNMSEQEHRLHCLIKNK